MFGVCSGFFLLGLWIIWTQMLDVGAGSKFFETYCQNFKSGGTYGLQKSLWLCLFTVLYSVKNGTSFYPNSHLYVCAGAELYPSIIYYVG